MRRVHSEAAEQASGNVMRTLAMGSLVIDLNAQPLGRLSGPRELLLADPRHSMVLPHLVAIVEEFSRTQLIDRSLAAIDLSHPLRRSLWDNAEKRAEGSWDAQVDAWREWHGLNLSDAGADYASLRAFVEARNAIMHGLGRLTRKQLRKNGGRDVIAALGRVGISVSGATLSLPETVLLQCAAVARSFIEWLDIKIQGLP